MLDVIIMPGLLVFLGMLDEGSILRKNTVDFYGGSMQKNSRGVMIKSTGIRGCSNPKEIEILNMKYYFYLNVTYLIINGQHRNFQIKCQQNRYQSMPVVPSKN